MSKLPTAESLSRQRWLRPVAHRLFEHGLWHAKTESVARGVAIGVFWAFVVPFLQIVFAAAHCIWWRANIPVAAGVTLITNPLTVGGWLWLAYQLGSLFVSPGAAAPAGDGVLGQLQALGWPTVVGMVMFAVGGSILGYGGVKLFSRVRLVWRIRRRTLRKRAARV
ncbi:MAG: DUF2062 domain-containing protein [Aquincola sp.]|nr:DUF2062 domain-containing protein [Aquincola sp.]MDH4288561.1 DUF2062 domain-containing protein [Aquincola sp.]